MFSDVYWVEYIFKYAFLAYMYSLFIMIIRIYLQYYAGYIIAYCNVVCILQHVYVYNYNYIYIYPLFIVYYMYVYHVHILRMWSLGVYIYMCIHVIYIYVYIYVLVGGFNPSEKYEFVSWDFYSQYMESHKTHVPNHQPVYIYT